MSSSLPSTQRWLTIRTQFGIDAAIVLFSVWIAAAIRFSDWWPEVVVRYWPALVIDGIALPSLIYIFGLYSLQSVHIRKRERLVLLLVAFAFALLLQMAMGSMDFSSRIGRGVLLWQIPVGLGLLLVHHALLVRRSLGTRRRVALVITADRDRQALHLLEKLNPAGMQVAGYFAEGALTQQPKAEFLGGFDSLVTSLEENKIHTLVCDETHLRNFQLEAPLREVCFSGHPVISMTDLLEEAYEAVPLSLVNTEWLVVASAMPRRRYARKLKRFFDVTSALFFGVLLAPALALGIILVTLTSPGPIFYQQERCGRYGRRFQVWKLRTMRIDAEKNGAQWAAGRRDPRLTLVGGLLRTFRIDEIPQLWNILKGDMSFVGPRPERPEFVEMLTVDIPFFKERLLVQPGLTGWAQVCYPYGASVEDARRKLEYDLYYMKHMSLMLDAFILLDTVRTVLRGGAKRHTTGALIEIEQMMTGGTMLPQPS